MCFLSFPSCSFKPHTDHLLCLLQPPSTEHSFREWNKSELILILDRACSAQTLGWERLPFVCLSSFPLFWRNLRRKAAFSQDGDGPYHHKPREVNRVPKKPAQWKYLTSTKLAPQTSENRHRDPKKDLTGVVQSNPKYFYNSAFLAAFSSREFFCASSFSSPLTAGVQTLCVCRGPAGCRACGTVFPRLLIQHLRGRMTVTTQAGWNHSHSVADALWNEEKPNLDKQILFQDNRVALTCMCTLVPDCVTAFSVIHPLYLPQKQNLSLTGYILHQR